MKIKETLKKVHYVLENDFASRDNDRRLIWLVWEKDVGPETNKTIILNSITKEEFLYSDNLSDVITIRRCRQILQCANPLLRGNTYEARHHKAEKVKKEIKEETFKAILDSKYTRITKEIFDTLKVGDKIYFTHKDVICSDFLFNNNRWANDNFILGTKHTIVGKNNIALRILDSNNIQTYIAPSQFSILELIK